MQPPPGSRNSISAPGRDAPRFFRARLRWQRAQAWTVGLIRSFGYAFAGIYQLVRRQRNAQIHVVIAGAVVVTAWAFGLSRIEWLVLILAIMVVIGMEAANTAIETVVDLVSPQYHPLAKQAKDVAAGAVLLVAIGAVAIGVLLFGGRLLEILRTAIG